MLLRSPARATRAVLSAAAVAALSAAGLAVTPSQAAAPRTLVGAPVLATTTAAATPPKPSVHVVTLVTGDRVVLRTDTAGRSLASFTPRSPHARKPFVNAAFNGHHYVVPKLPAAQQRLFDPSVFDVAALSGQARQTLDVTFRAGSSGATARSLPGLAIRKGSARTGSGGRITVQATYDASRPLPAGFTAALGSVSRIRVAGTANVTPQLGPAYELHPLTINALSAHGAPMRFGFVFVLNMDDGRLFGAFGEIIDGQWKVQVPDGHYVVMVQDFSRVALGQALVAGDTTTSVSLADATTKPTMSFPGHPSIAPEIDLLFGDASGHSSSSFGFGGSLPRLTPLAHLAAGTLYTEIANQWSARGYKPFSFTSSGGFKINPIKQVASAKQVRRGIPDTLSYRYDEHDFAVVDQKFYSTGAPVQGFTGWVGISPLDSFVFFSGWPTERPGRVKTMFLAHSRQTIFWLTDAQLTTGFQHFAFTDSIRRYLKPVHRTEPFFRGPLTPVVDRDHNSDASGLHCQLCVAGGKLRGSMSTLTTAGTTQEGFADTARWALLGKRDLVAQGRVTVSPRNVPVAAGTPLTLLVSSQRAEKVQTLSTRVLDAYGFTVPSADGAVPILRADYVPPTDLESRGPSGTVRFPVTFSNLGPAESRVVHARVGFSVDGAHTWRAATLTRQDKNTFRVSYPEPRATKRHRFVSLEVSARDAQGRTVSELVRNAYLLPRAGSGAAHATSTPSTTAVPSPGRAFRPSRVCATPDQADYSCFVRLDARTRLTGRASPDPRGWGAPAIRDAYDLPSTGADTTVAVIVAYDYPSAEADMNKYRRQFGLPQCTSASGCFTKINQRGETASYPPADEGWGVEASLDLQMISTSCPTCHIVLAEANQPSDRAFNRTIRSAVAQGATVTNHSYGRIELTGDDAADGAYSLPGVTAVVASGDSGYGPAQFPASSPHVVAVGGTTLQRSLDPRGWLEKVWAGGGSGCSAYFAKPAWQSDTACHARTATDVSAVARGLAIYNTSLPRRFRGWLEVDGTSASSPLIAGMIGSAGTPGLTPDVLYANAADFNDVVAGRNGFCNDSYLCTAGPGYDAPTGLGTPEGVTGFVGP